MTATAPVVAERAMYWKEGEGHVSVGATEPAKQWYLPEGYTGSGHSSWVLVLNPNDQPAQIHVTVLPEGAAPVTYDYTVQAQTRYNLWMNQIVPDKSFSVQVDSDQPVVVERSQYWDKNQGGTNSPGLTRLSQRWLLPEGSTAAPFDTFILIENPGGDAANVKVTMRSGDGRTSTRTIGAAAKPLHHRRQHRLLGRRRGHHGRVGQAHRRRGVDLQAGAGRDGIPGIIPSP